MSNPNSQAFPAAGHYNHGDRTDYSGHSGMTLREYLIGQALAGLCAGYYDRNAQENNITLKTVAADAVIVADRVLGELNPPPSGPVPEDD